MTVSGLIARTDSPLCAAEPAAAPTFAQVYESHFAFVWRSALRLGVPDASVEDLVQEIFVVVHRRLPSFEGRASVRTWLFGITANVVRAYRRAQRARGSPPGGATGCEPDALIDGAPGPDERATRAEAARVVLRLLDSLDDDKREVFILAELEQMSAPEIAAALGVPLNTVYSRLRLAREHFAAAAARERARDAWRTR